MAVIREVVGETLRTLRLRQRRTLREVSAGASVSLGYLSEIERGQKEPSSELLAAICSSLDVELSELFAEVSQVLQREEKRAAAGRVTVLGTATTRLTPAPQEASAGSARIRTLPGVTAVATPAA